MFKKKKKIANWKLWSWSGVQDQRHVIVHVAALEILARAEKIRLDDSKPR
jgi:hypothetical protein